MGCVQHHMLPQRGRREGQNRQMKRGLPASVNTHGDKPDQRQPKPTRQTHRAYTGRIGLGITQADPPMKPVSPAVRAIDPERFVVSRAARPLVPASTTGDSQAREFASYVACDTTPSLAKSAVRCSHSRWLFAGRAENSLCRPSVDDVRRENRAARRLLSPPHRGTVQYSNVGRGGQTGIMRAMQTPADSGHSPSLTAAHELTIDEHHAGQRIDNFLIACLKGLPRTRIYRILRRGEVRVNKGRIRQHYRLKSGDVVRIPPMRLAKPGPSQAPHPAFGERVEECILFEDRGLIVLDKPSGMAVHGGSGLSHGVIEALRAARGERHYLELVHRLDRDTSGCLMIAKRRPVLTALHAALRHAKVGKRYLVLVKGHWQDGTRDVESGLLRNVLRSGERLVRVDASGKIGRTRFVPRALGAHASLMEARPFTGRTHQIRVHAASAGHPVAGDAKYGERAFNQRMRDHGLHRLFLHAASLDFENPGDGARIKVEAPLPAPLLAVLASLKLDAER